MNSKKELVSKVYNYFLNGSLIDFIDNINIKIQDFSPEEWNELVDIISPLIKRKLKSKISELKSRSVKDLEDIYNSTEGWENYNNVFIEEIKNALYEKNTYNTITEWMQRKLNKLNKGLEETQEQVKSQFEDIEEDTEVAKKIENEGIVLISHNFKEIQENDLEKEFEENMEAKENDEIMIIEHCNEIQENETNQLEKEYKSPDIEGNMEAKENDNIMLIEHCKEIQKYDQPNKSLEENETNQLEKESQDMEAKKIEHCREIQENNQLNEHCKEIQENDLSNEHCKEIQENHHSNEGFKENETNQSGKECKSQDNILKMKENNDKNKQKYQLQEVYSTQNTEVFSTQYTEDNTEDILQQTDGNQITKNSVTIMPRNNTKEINASSTKRKILHSENDAKKIKLLSKIVGYLVIKYDNQTFRGAISYSLATFSYIIKYEPCTNDWLIKLRKHVKEMAITHLYVRGYRQSNYLSTFLPDIELFYLKGKREDIKCVKCSKYSCSTGKIRHFFKKYYYYDFDETCV